MFVTLISILLRNLTTLHLLYAVFYVPLFKYTTYATIFTTITTHSLFLSVYNLFASNACSLFFSHNHSIFCFYLFISTNTYSLNLYSEELQTTAASSHKADWITTNSLPVLSCLLIVQHEESNESSWSRMFLFSTTQELYCTSSYLSIPFSLKLVVTWIVFDVFVSMYFVHVACCVYAYVYPF